MVDPKKDYELLMRYLQGDRQKREPAAVPEQTNPEEWQVPTQPAAAATQPAEPLANRPPRAVPKPYHFRWPTWQPVVARNKTRIGIAAAALLLLGIIFWKSYRFYQLSPDAIYHNLYAPFSIPAASVEKNSIAQYYASKNYVAATLKAKKQKLLSEEEKLLTGLSFLQRDDYSAAIKWLEPLSNNFKSPYRQQAEFYVALTYLKNEDFDHCIEKMEHIAYAPTHPYHDRISQDLINDIKMLKWK